MFVFDSSAYISPWRHHLPRETFPGVWAFIEAAMEDGRIISPRAVYTELEQKDDDVYKWGRQRAASFVEPTEAVQRDAGVIYADFPQNSLRNAADPWVIAEARARELTVVTYEGQTFSGVPTTRWHRSMPGICGRHDVACVTLPEALGLLGGLF